MKRLFFMLLAAVTFVACDKVDDDTPKPIELTGGTQTNQTIFADETEKSQSIKFKATAAWTATVSDVTKANDKDSWLRLNVYQGDAGDVALTISLDKNDTGKDRKAEIRILCGGTTITITVEQKATNKPEDPDDPTKPTMRYVKKATSQSSSDRGDSYRSVMAYEYDDQMRIVKMVNQSTEIYAGTTTEHNSNIYFTYKDNTISLKSREVKDGVEQEAQDALAITLNPDGTTKQSITFGVFTSNSDPETESKPAPFPFLTRSSASKATVITRYKTTFDYTYDAQGYVTKIAQKRETENGTVTQEDDYSVLWSGGNLIKVETTYEGKKVYDEFKYSNIENKLCNWDASLMTGEWSSEAFNVVGQLGLMGERNKYLPSSITTASPSGNITTYSHQYTYKLDKDGYVIELEETGVGNSTYKDNVTIEYVK